jgi:hypothetical protein
LVPPAQPPTARIKNLDPGVVMGAMDGKRNAHGLVRYRASTTLWSNNYDCCCREMNRTVRLGGWGLVSGAERTVITPNENAADTLDVSPLTLEDLAQEVLGEGRGSVLIKIDLVSDQSVSISLIRASKSPQKAL